MTPPRFLVAWKVKGELKTFQRTSKPTALSHVKALKRNPQVESIGMSNVICVRLA